MKQRPGPIAVVVKVLLSLLYGVPLVWIVLTSLRPSSEVFDPITSFHATFDAYSAAISLELWVALRQSVLIASGTTALVLLIGIPAAYGLARVGGRVTSAVLALLIILQMAPQTANLIPLFQLFGVFGLLDKTVGVILADAALLTPFAIMLLRPFFVSVPISLEEAASIDGAGLLRAFTSVVLPVARNGVFTVGTLVFMLAWGEFLYAVNFFLSPGTYPLSALLSQQVSAFGINWPGLMALAVLTSLPILVLYAIAYRYLRDGLAVGAVK